MPPPTATAPLSRFLTFDRDAWAKLRDSTPLTLSEDDLDALRGLNEKLSLQEVVEIYLPLSRLLNLHVRAAQALYRASQTFLGNHGREGAVHHRPGRQRRRGQEHHRARAAGAALALAQPPVGGPGHDRRVPVPERRARERAA